MIPPVPSEPKDPDRLPLAFPTRLYGREAELDVLTKAFTEVGAGAGRMLLLPGPSGSGKTALIRTLREPVQAKNGFLLEGKFNQYQQGIPLFVWRQALQQLLAELRSLSPAEQSNWKTRTLEAVGDLGRLLTDVAPEWEGFLGPQPPVGDISPFEAPHRFASVLRRFLAVFCRAEHPVVLFLDDWQWADAASLAVLPKLQIHSSLRYLLVLAAYRDDEVDASHPFLEAVEELRRQATPLAALTVNPLALADIGALLRDTLTPAIKDAGALASLLLETTHGNPFFIRALLESLHARQALWFDAPRRCWGWNREDLVAHGQATDVTRLFVGDLLRLPEECRELLALAACLGNRFDLEALASVSRRSAADCAQRLQSALKQRIILPLEGAPGHFLFRHDRVQQAAHSLIPPDQLAGVRLGIGRLLRRSLPPTQIEEQLLEITDHFNAGRALLREEAELDEIVALNIAAGRRARATTSYRAALHFHRVASEYLARPDFTRKFWGSRHDLALGFFKDWSESEFLEGDRGKAQACLEEALAHTRTPLEEADVLCALVLEDTLLSRYAEAIAAGRRALAALGISLPESDFETARDAEVARVRQLLAVLKMESLRATPPMSDPKMLMIVRVLITLGPPCYRFHPRLWSVLVPKVVALTLEHGPVPQIGYSHPALGGLLGWVDGDYSTARQFGELAESLMREVFPSPSDQSVFRLMIGSSTRHWFAPLSAASEDYALAWEAGLRSGNLQYAAYAFGHNMYCRFFQGLPLDRLIEESERSLAFGRTRTNQWAIDLLEGGLHVVRTLAGRPSPDEWSEAAHLDAVETHRNLQVACIYRVLREFSLLVLGETERARELSDEAEAGIHTVGTQGLLPWPEHVFTRTLILAAAHPHADAVRQSTWREEMNRAVARLETWAAHAPVTYRFKLEMALAEIAWLDGRGEAALEHYEAAIEGAEAGRFTQWEAWANERAAHLARATGAVELGEAYWQNAYLAWHRWGAMAKVDRLEREFLSRAPGNRRTPTAGTNRLGRHLDRLRQHAVRLAGTSADREPAGLVREFAEATDRLREEVARRKTAETQLERHRDQLSREIAARTRDLELSQELARKFEAQTRELQEQRQGLLVAQAAMLNLVEDATAARDRAEEANTALRASELKARRQAEELETLMDLAPLAIWVAHDPECRHITGNHTANAFFEAALGENVSAGPPASSAHETGRRFFRNGQELAPDELPMQQAVRTNAEVRGVELKVVGPHIRSLTLLGNASPLRDEAGQVRGCIGCFMDITERKQVEEALSQRERQLQAAQAVAHLGSWHLDLAPYRLTWSDEVCRIFARPGPPATREEFLAYIFPEDRAGLERAWQATLTGATYDLEHRIVAEGTIKWVHQKAALEYDAQGRPVGCLGTVQDITDRKRAEEALRQSEERVRLKLDSILSPDVEVTEEELVNLLDIPALQSLLDDFSRLTHAVVAVLDTKGKVLLNSGWQDICSVFHRGNPLTAQACTESDLALSGTVQPGEHTAYRCRNGLWDVVTPLMIGGKHLGNIFTGQFFYENDTVDEAAFAAQAARCGFDRDTYLAALHKVPRVSREWVSSLMVFLKKFSELVSKSSYSNLKLAKALVQQKRIENDLRTSEEQFRTMFQMASIGMAQADPVTGLWRRVNRKLCEITGYSEAELLRMQAQEAIHPEDRPRAQESFQQVARGDIPHYRLEKRYVRKDGTLAWVNVNTTVIRDAQGRPLHTMTAIEDITERKRLEQERTAMEGQLRHQQKLESIGTLASGVAHEINNPINGIMNYAQLIQDRLPGDSPLTEFTGEILHETQRVATIVRNLLTFSRNDKQSHSPARIEDIVNAVLSLVRAVIRHDRITLNLDLPEDLPPLKCRSQQIQQVIMNLVTNARDALNERFPDHDPDKVLNLAARLLRRDGRRWIRLTVEDHGTGIPPEVRERMFDPFFTTKGRSHGTGLGLSISHGIVKEHHGLWTVESEPGRFTRMHVELPVDNGWEL